ncbi:hypothetical protein PEBR_38392 [Penicillium brasilianum]|uniref:Uncharacterized protein n=1 Tax=Penicillium brasilianum TaxID=104259 RepID=A0A1S9RCC1_PENBI|nr:hypothetical protein PEBR_38392 [Penicillium brasilianum]
MLFSLSRVFSVVAISFCLQATVSSAIPHSSRLNALLPRGDDYNNGQVAWTDMTSGDGQKDGKDTNGVPYIKYLIDYYVNKFSSEDRVGVFWTGGTMTEDDYDNIYEFIESETRLDNHGKIFKDVFDNNYLTNEMGIDTSNQNNLYWRSIYRASKALAAGATNGKAYVYLNPAGCRTIFSPASQTPLDEDPAHDGEATVGEVWAYVELPMLMRNTNVNQIISFYKQGRKFVTNIEWDVTTDTQYPRTYLSDLAMDAVPITLPASANRASMKRSGMVGGGW